MTMPNFLIIGAAKCGTTALYRYLEQHPEIYMSYKKEPSFFALEGEKPDFRGPADARGINRSRFTNIETYTELFRDVSNEKAVGEASTLYLYCPKAARRIRSWIPDAKLIAVLRNPVDRAYSAFLFMVRDSREPLADFAQALREEEARIERNWGPEYHYRRRGLYYLQLKRYFDLFDRDQIRVYLYDDLASDSESVLQDIFRFLRVDDTFTPDVSSKHNISGIPRSEALQSLYLFLRGSNPVKAMLKPLLPKELRRKMYRRTIDSVRSRILVKPPQLSPEVREELIEVYREDILHLQDLIRRDLSGWLN